MGGIHGTFLRSAVGRRMFALFLFSSTVPLALLAILTYRGVSDLLERQVEAELGAYGKSYGIEVFARLRAAQAMLARIGSARDAGERRSALVGAEGERPFAAAAAVDERGAIGALAGLAQLPPALLGGALDAPDAPGLRPGADALLALAGHGAEAPLLLVHGAGSGGAHRGRLVAALDPGYVFGDADSLPAQTGMCAIDAQRGAVLHCSDPRLAAAALAWARATGAAAPADASFAAGAWTLLPTTNLNFGRWVFVALRPAGSGVLANRHVAMTYIEAALAGLVLVGFLSLTQIRRTLVPLEQLMDATRRIAAADFSQPVACDRPDEFGALAGAFNHMAQALERRIAALRTLAAIDQEILGSLDLDRIAGQVLALARQLLPDGVFALTHIAAGATGAIEVPLWLAGETAPRRLHLPADAPERVEFGRGQVVVIDPSAAHRAGAMGRILLDAGARAGVLVPILTRNSARIVIGAGTASGATPDGAVIEQLVELGKRVGVAVDAAGREAQLIAEARNDHLTGLPNRLCVHEIIERWLAGAVPHPFALLFIDLDRFKSVNDGLGHDAGDALLVEAAARIGRCLGTQDVLARLGGDEFIVLTRAIEPRERIDELAHGIIRALSQKMSIGPVEAHVSASVGIAHFPGDGTRREDLIRNADTAMYRAKEGGRGRAVHFQPAMGRAAFEILALEKDLRAALEAGQIRVHFQPRVFLADGRLNGAEALARWDHPQRGSVPPERFIRLAEEIGLIERLGEDVLAQTCAWLAAQQRRGVACRPISVNVSTRQLQNPQIGQRLGAIVAAAGVTPALIELEITESALVNDLPGTRARLEDLRRAGFRIALDDFGTGYSSLSYLQSLPIDVMKIDRSFVKDIEHSAGSRAIAVAIISLAHTLGLRVVAEGVETGRQAAWLRQWGCDEAQGFLYARPLPADDYVRLLAEPSAAHAASA